MRKPALKVEPTYDLAEIAQAYKVSYSYIWNEVNANRLKAAQKGLKLVSTQAEINDWWNARHERQADRRAGRVARRDQRGKAPTKAKAKTNYRPDVDDDIARALGLQAKTKAGV